MKTQDLNKMINKCVAAKSTFPSWYTTKVGNDTKNDKSIPRKGEVILHEQENAKSILNKHSNHLNGQISLNFEATSTKTGSDLDKTNTDMEIIISMPGRVELNKRTNEVKVLYSRVDEFIRTVEEGNPYTNFTVDDNVMGICRT